MFGFLEKDLHVRKECIRWWSRKIVNQFMQALGYDLQSTAKSDRSTIINKYNRLNLRDLTYKAQLYSLAIGNLCKLKENMHVIKYILWKFQAPKWQWLNGEKEIIARKLVKILGSTSNADKLTYEIFPLPEFDKLYPFQIPLFEFIYSACSRLFHTWVLAIKGKMKILSSCIPKISCTLFQIESLTSI